MDDHGADGMPGHLARMLEDRRFAEAEVQLRRGRHVTKDGDQDLYRFIEDSQESLEAYYRCFGAELVHGAEGWFMLEVRGQILRTRPLSAGEMLVGLALARIMLDPALLQERGVISRERLLHDLDSLAGGHARLAPILQPRRRPRSEAQAQEIIRSAVEGAIRTLAGLGFLKLEADGRVIPRSALARFLDPARVAGDPAEEVSRLIERSRGIVVRLTEVPRHTADEPAEEE